MELTKKETEKVERFLNNNKLTYIDIRFEAYDHILTDIESIVKSQNIGFEKAFILVTNKWKKHFNETSSLYFGLYYSAPKMVIEKAKNYFKKFYFLYISTCFLPLILIQYLKAPIFVDIISIVFPYLQAMAVFATFFFLFLMIKKRSTKEKTTYSFILKTQNANLVLGLLITVKFLFTDNDSMMNPIWITFIIVFLIATFIYYIFYKKHIEALKQNKIL